VKLLRPSPVAGAHDNDDVLWRRLAAAVKVSSAPSGSEPLGFGLVPGRWLRGLLGIMNA
jgi:hypothetical protein